MAHIKDYPEDYARGRERNESGLTNSAGCGGGPMQGHGCGTDIAANTVAPRNEMRDAQERLEKEHIRQKEREEQAGRDAAFKVGYEAGRIDSQDPVHFLFQYHKGGPEQLAKYDAINIACENLFRVIQSQCPAGEDKFHALKQVQVCRMLANMSVALNGKGVQMLPGVMF